MIFFTDVYRGIHHHFSPPPFGRNIFVIFVPTTISSKSKEQKHGILVGKSCFSLSQLSVRCFFLNSMLNVAKLVNLVLAPLDPKTIEKGCFKPYNGLYNP